MDVLRIYLTYIFRSLICYKQVLRIYSNHRLSGQTIVEALVAMIIIVISFGIGMSIYMNVLVSNHTIAKVNVDVQLNSVLEQTKLEKSFTSEVLDTGFGTIEKNVSAYKDNQENQLIVLRFYDPKKKLIQELREIIYFVEVE